MHADVTEPKKWFSFKDCLLTRVRDFTRRCKWSGLQYLFLE